MAWSEFDYIKTVDGIAEDAIKEYPFDIDAEHEGVDEEREQYVRESVDGNEYIAYYGANEIALRASQNEPDGEDVSAMSADDADWRTMRAIAAYMAMEADVMEQIERLFKLHPCEKPFPPKHPIAKSRNTKLEGETLINYLMQRFNYTEVEARQKAKRIRYVAKGVIKLWEQPRLRMMLWSK